MYNPGLTTRNTEQSQIEGKEFQIAPGYRSGICGVPGIPH
jgi:hypothetical protein